MGGDDAHIVVWALGDVRGELVVVNPNPGGVADGDAVVVQDVADLEVADDHVGHVEHVQPLAGDLGSLANANDRLVGTNLGAGREVERALDEDNLRVITQDGRAELGRGSDRHGGAALTTGGGTDRVVLCETLNVPGREAEGAQGGRGRQRGQRGEDGDKVEPHCEGPGCLEQSERSCRGYVDRNTGSCPP